MSIPQKSVEAKIGSPSGFLWVTSALAFVFFVISAGLAIWEDDYIPYSLAVAWIGFVSLAPLVLEEDRPRFIIRTTLLVLLCACWYALSENYTLTGLVLALLGVGIGLLGSKIPTHNK